MIVEDVRQKSIVVVSSLSINYLACCLGVGIAVKKVERNRVVDTAVPVTYLQIITYHLVVS